MTRLRGVSWKEKDLSVDSAVIENLNFRWTWCNDLFILPILQASLPWLIINKEELIFSGGSGLILDQEYKDAVIASYFFNILWIYCKYRLPGPLLLLHPELHSMLDRIQFCHWRLHHKSAPDCFQTTRYHQLDPAHQRACNGTDKLSTILRQFGAWIDQKCTKDTDFHLKSSNMPYGSTIVSISAKEILKIYSLNVELS